MKRRDLVGQRFNKLKVVSRYGVKGSYRAIAWNCLCDCGEEAIVRGDHLLNGTIKSCGCYRKSLLENSNISRMPHNYKEALSSKYKSYKWSAHRRKIDFQLKEDEAINLLSSNCFYCGIKPSQETFHKEIFYYNGIDRVNNEIGYIIDNCVSCCGQCNRAKFTGTVREFSDWIDRTYHYMQSRGILSSGS